MIVRQRFPRATLEAINAAIARGEKTHNGQIRFVIEAELTTAQLWADVRSRERAFEIFSQFQVWDTEANNGVLIYVLLADRKVEILADRGIHKQVGSERWAAICREVELYYRKGDFLTGSVVAIDKINAEIAHYFPPREGQVNEQPDQAVVM